MDEMLGTVTIVWRMLMKRINTNSAVKEEKAELVLAGKTSAIVPR
jgi:hypothetical protein